MKTLITGAGGFVGSHAVDWLLAKTDWELIALDSFRHRGDRGRLEHVLGHPRLQVLRADLAVPIPLRLAAELAQVEQVFNFASDSAVERSISDPRQCWENNVNLMLNVLELCRGLRKLKVLMHVSTDEVYGPAAHGERHAEWATIRPSNPYSASKGAQECLAFSYWRTFGLPVVIVNAMNMVGPRQDPEKFLPGLVGKLLRGEEAVIHGGPVEVGTRFYTHAANVADAMLFLAGRKPAQYQLGADRPDRWNVVGEREVTNLELAEMVAEQLGKPLVYRFIDFKFARPGHDARYALDGAKLAAEGWAPPIALADTVRDTVAWYVANPSWLAA